MNALLYKRDLMRAIKAAIARQDSGTVGIGRDCLWQCLRFNSPHAPTGTNAAFVVRQDFNAMVATPPFNRFVYL